MGPRVPPRVYTAPLYRNLAHLPPISKENHNLLLPRLYARNNNITRHACVYTSRTPFGNQVKSRSIFEYLRASTRHLSPRTSVNLFFLSPETKLLTRLSFSRPDENLPSFDGRVFCATRRDARHTVIRRKRHCSFGDNIGIRCPPCGGNAKQIKIPSTG